MAGPGTSNPGVAGMPAPPPGREPGIALAPGGLYSAGLVPLAHAGVPAADGVYPVPTPVKTQAQVLDVRLEHSKLSCSSLRGRRICCLSHALAVLRKDGFVGPQQPFCRKPLDAASQLHIRQPATLMSRAECFAFEMLLAGQAVSYLFSTLEMRQ